MSVILSAIFESVDVADFALADLRRGGINIEAFKIRPIHAPLVSSDHHDSLGFANNLGAFAAPTLVFNSTFMPVKDRHELRNEEVVMKVTVSDRDAANTQAQLVSANGRRVKPEM